MHNEENMPARTGILQKTLRSPQAKQYTMDTVMPKEIPVDLEFGIEWRKVFGRGLWQGEPGETCSGDQPIAFEQDCRPPGRQAGNPLTRLLFC
jgi:hypothetical protein